jgi:hypothetical protein
MHHAGYSGLAYPAVLLEEILAHVAQRHTVDALKDLLRPRDSEEADHVLGRLLRLDIAAALLRRHATLADGADELQAPAWGHMWL